MLSDIQIKSFGPLTDVCWPKPSPQINVVIGENASGKTFLLKILYTAVRVLEEFGRGNDNRGVKQVLDEKLYWTFQADRIGDLVSKGAKERLKFFARLDEQPFTYEFSASAEKGVGSYSIQQKNRDSVSLFLPAKEVLSLFHIIKKSRAIDQEFGFDDTYYDLVKALEKAPTKGRNFDQFAKARTLLAGMLHGYVDFSENKWRFSDQRGTYSIHQTAEGYKRIGLIDWLLGNRTLTPQSILFIDEPDAVLHPRAIVGTLDMLALLAEAGLQIFMATHSIFVLRKLYLLAKTRETKVQLLDLSGGSFCVHDLSNGIPENLIVNTSTDLFVEEMKANG